VSLVFQCFALWMVRKDVMQIGRVWHTQLLECVVLFRDRV